MGWQKSRLGRKRVSTFITCSQKRRTTSAPHRSLSTTPHHCARAAPATTPHESQGAEIGSIRSGVATVIYTRSHIVHSRRRRQRVRRRFAPGGPCVDHSPLLIAATRPSRIGQLRPPSHGSAATSPQQQWTNHEHNCNVVASLRVRKIRQRKTTECHI